MVCVKHELEAKVSAHHYHELLRTWGSQFLPSALDLEAEDGNGSEEPCKMKEHEASLFPPVICTLSRSEL